MNNTITINGTRFKVSGRNISINDNAVYVDGKLVQGDLHGDVNIRFEGEIANLTCNGSATVNGVVNGNVDAGGSVSCGYVHGNVDSGGSVVCGNVDGRVDAGGSISMRR